MWRTHNADSPWSSHGWLPSCGTSSPRSAKVSSETAEQADATQISWSFQKQFTLIKLICSSRLLTWSKICLWSFCLLCCYVGIVCYSSWKLPIEDQWCVMQTAGTCVSTWYVVKTCERRLQRLAPSRSTFWQTSFFSLSKLVLVVRTWAWTWDYSR